MTTPKTGFSAQQQEQLGTALTKDRAVIHTRKGDNSRDLEYLEGHTVISQLNRIFGFDGWGYSIDDRGVDEYTDGPAEGWYALFWAQVTLQVTGSGCRTDIGRQEIRNTFKNNKLNNNVRNVDQRSLGITACVTDALKRAARTYGEQFGNGLYDSDHDTYTWMAANRLESDEERQARLAVIELRETVLRGLNADKEATAKLVERLGKDIASIVQTMAVPDLEKTLTRLQERAHKAV